MNGVKLETQLFEIAKSFNFEYLDVDGGVYYRGLRPIQKNTSLYQEDIVVAFLTGTSGDVQKGTCLVNVYVPNIQAKSGVYYQNKERCAIIAEALEQFPTYANLHAEGVNFKQSDMIYTFAEDGINQHFVSLKMEFRVLNKNY